MLTAKKILNQYWGYDQFLGQQEAIINTVLQKKHVLAVLPTGAGKSICFQIPALMMDGCCLVISPLVALMKDQVNNLNKKNIPATYLHSGLTYFEIRQQLIRAVNNEFKFIYLSPERITNQLFLEYLPAITVGLIAIDEAHCISQWGYDFRPSYLQISHLFEELPDTPVLALTASATIPVQTDIVEKLKIWDAAIFRQSFLRPNLSYSTFCVEDKINKVIEIISKVRGSSLIYCSSRRLVKQVADLLLLQKINADFYHAGLTLQERSKKQELWQNDKIQVMVCTNAFGMGIDKSNVRTVIHYNIPDCIENYYQEAGRAGRDRKKSFAVLLYQQHELTDLHKLPDIKYPSVLNIRLTYQCLADFLQIPVGAGEGQRYDFIFEDFIHAFKLARLETQQILKTLEGEGFISLSDKMFIPSKIIIHAERDEIENVESPNNKTVLSCLLRTYEGVLGNEVSVNEKQLAGLCDLTEPDLLKTLHYLQSIGILSYTARKETPSIYFYTNRAPAAYLHIDMQTYVAKKTRYTERLGKIIIYIGEKSICRSKFIANYFGDSGASDCGICDNCLTRKKKKNNSADLYASIKLYVANGNRTVPVLLRNFKHVQEEELLKMIEWLLSEEQIALTEEGVIKWLA